LIRFISFFRTERDQVRPALEARREYLEAAFAVIDTEYGGFERYRREVLDVSDAERDQLRALLLEPRSASGQY
jgi:protein-tyrosine phosphatase